MAMSMWMTTMGNMRVRKDSGSNSEDTEADEAEWEDILAR